MDSKNWHGEFGSRAGSPSRGKGLVWLGSAILLAVLEWAVLAASATRHQSWLRLRPLFWQPTWPGFADFNIYQQGLRAWAAGIDPLSADPASTKIIFNYPRVWLWGRHLGLDHIPLAAGGLILAAAFLAAVCLLLRPRTPAGFLACAVALLAPPARFALERGNIDLIVFIILAGTLLAGSPARPRAAAWIQALGCSLAAILKLYPWAWLAGAAAAERGYRRRAFALAAAASALFLALDFRELELVSGRTPRPNLASYGAAVLADRIRAHHHSDAGISVGDYGFTPLRLASSGLFLAAMGAAAGLTLAGRFRFAFSRKAEAAWPPFLAGASIYLGTFLLGNNWSYRLIFLIFCLPFLLAESRSGGGARRWAVLTLVSGALAFCAPLTAAGWLFAAVQAASWLLGLLLTAGIARRVLSAREPRSPDRFVD